MFDLGGKRKEAPIKGDRRQLTDAMNIPKRPPIPKPMTPDIADFPKQDSIIAFIYKTSQQASCEVGNSKRRGPTALMLGSF
jgi:hypothetical protein